MENLILLSESIRLNTDIFETNVINIAILLALLVNVVGGALKTSMLERKEKILDTVQDAEQRLQEASERLLEAKTQLNQSRLVINKIEEDNLLLIGSIALANRNRALAEVDRQANATALTLVYKQQQVLREIKDEVAQDALSKALKFCREQLKLDTQIQLIDDAIDDIGGKKWQVKF